MLTLIRDATVLTIDAARNVYPDGAVAVEVAAAEFFPYDLLYAESLAGCT